MLLLFTVSQLTKWEYCFCLLFSVNPQNCLTRFVMMYFQLIVSIGFHYLNCFCMYCQPHRQSHRSTAFYNIICCKICLHMWNRLHLLLELYKCDIKKLCFVSSKQFHSTNSVLISAFKKTHVKNKMYLICTTPCQPWNCYVFWTNY